MASLPPQISYLDAIALRQQPLPDVSLSHPLLLDQSGDPALVYHSSEVADEPIVQLQLQSPNNAMMPGSVSAWLTFNGTAGATVTYSTFTVAGGQTLTLGLQAGSAVTTTGLYGYSVSVSAGGFSSTYGGSVFVVAQDSSALGAGWGFAGVAQLVAVTGGVLRVYGSGGYRFYSGSGTFTSPAGDDGTLTQVGGTYTYSTPDGQSSTFDSSGYETGWTSADGHETLQYRYDGSDRLSGITAIDGALTTFTYDPGSVVIQTVNNRTTTLTISGSSLASITDPDGGVRTLTYDGSGHLTSEQFGLLQDEWAYTSAGVLGTYTWGAAFSGTGSNPDNTVVQPVWTLGLGSPFGMNAPAVGTLYGKVTDPVGDVTRYQLDGQGRHVQEVAGDGGLTTLAYSNGFLTGRTDPLGRMTTYALDAAGYVTKATYADGTSVTYQYQSAFHALTTMTDERGDPRLRRLRAPDGADGPWRAGPDPGDDHPPERVDARRLHERLPHEPGRPAGC